MIGPIVVAPAPFKGALSAAGAARAIAAGIQLAATGTQVRVVPIADGGEGTLEALVAARGGRRRATLVPDPLGRPSEAAIGELPGHTCVIELAQASGFERLAASERDPELTSTYGTGARRGDGRRHARRTAAPITRTPVLCRIGSWRRGWMTLPSTRDGFARFSSTTWLAITWLSKPLDSPTTWAAA